VSPFLKNAALGAVLAAGLAGPVRAAEPKPLRKELAVVADAIHSHLRNRSAAVTVEEFTCADKPPTNHGPGICLTLSQEFTRLGLRLDRNALFRVKGAYKVIYDTTLPVKQLAIKLEVRLEEGTANPVLVLDIARAIVDEETVASMLGLTVALPPAGDEEKRTNALAEGIKQETRPHLDHTRVRATPASPYAVELLAKRGGDYEPVRPRLEEGAAYAPLTRDDVYALRLVNDSDHEAAVTVTVDGIDLFAFSDVKITSLILPPRSSGLVRGWPVRLDRANEFKVTSYAESAAFRLQSAVPVGVVNVAFAAAWPKDGTPPPDEPRQRTRGSRAGDATGHGAPVGDRYQPVERAVGVLRASVSIRYTK
jgi:hypothetical protein